MSGTTRGAIASLAIALLAGCINVGIGGDAKHLEMHRHVVDAVTGIEPRPGNAPGLAVRGFAARSRYDIHVVRRDSADDFSYLDFERWGEPPADAATDAVREGIAASRAFSFVSSAGDALEVERFLDGYVLAFDLVKTKTGPWKARFSVRLSLSDRTGKMLHTGVFETVRDLRSDSPLGLGPTMAGAISGSVNAALAEWAAAGLLK